MSEPSEASGSGSDGAKRTLSSATVDETLPARDAMEADDTVKHEDKRAKTEGENEADDERICRYCLLGEDKDLGTLIDPCSCSGGQKYVHLECLRRWQRSVLVTQPTHPAFYECDDRQFVCQVCKSKFSVEPPSRAELMAGFTGPELAALLDVGCLIVCEPRTSLGMAQALQFNAHIAQVRSLVHWISSVYLIVSVDVRGEGGDDDDDEDEEDGQGEASEKDNSDGIVAVNLTARQDPPDHPIAAVLCPTPADPHIKLTHYRGGPCLPWKPTAVARLYHSTRCQVEHDLEGKEASLGGTQGGLWVSGMPKDVFQLVIADRKRRKLSSKKQEQDDSKEPAAVPSEPEAATRDSGDDDAHGEVQDATNAQQEDADDQQQTRSAETQEQADANVLIFWGDARWSRTQLLGEIARGSWCMCRGVADDVSTPPDELYARMLSSDRLIKAPQNEMMRDGEGEESDDGDDAEVQTAEDADAQARAMNARMAEHREQLRRQLLAQQRAYQQQRQPQGNVDGAASNTPAAEQDLHTCSQCGKCSDSVQRCARCKRAFYCGRACQRSAWPSHKKDCKPPPSN